ncbi:MAG: hypothetical protein U0625_11900 [Phycisphaerales bacterium]
MPAPHAIRRLCHAARLGARIPLDAAWTLLARTRLWLAGAQVGPGLRVTGWIRLHVHPTARVTLGPRVRIHSGGAVNLVGSGQRFGVHAGRDAVVEIGADAGLSGTVIVAQRSVAIGAGTLVGGGVLVVDSDLHALPLPVQPGAPDPRPPACAPVEIGRCVFIGAGATVLKGSRIGDGAVIGAGAVVAGEVPAAAVATGPCARPRLS